MFESHHVPAVTLKLCDRLLWKTIGWFQLVDEGHESGEVFLKFELSEPAVRIPSPLILAESGFEDTSMSDSALLFFSISHFNPLIMESIYFFYLLPLYRFLR